MAFIKYWNFSFLELCDACKVTNVLKEMKDAKKVLGYTHYQSLVFHHSLTLSDSKIHFSHESSDGDEI